MPDPCGVPWSFGMDLISWSASYDLYGAFQGTVNVSNYDSQYAVENTVWYPIKVSLSASATVDCGTVTSTSCFSGNKDWIHGLIQGISFSNEISEKRVSLNCTSFFTYLSKKPINTEYYYAFASQVLTDVALVYSGISSTLFNFISMAPNPIYGVVSGSNFVDEIKKIAQVGEANAFVQVGGLLTVERWKDHRSPIDAILPQEALISTEQNYTENIGPTRIVVRGGNIGFSSSGIRTLNSRNDNPLIFPSTILKHPTRMGSFDTALRVGIRQKEGILKLVNLKGNREDLTSSFFLVDPASSGGVTGVDIPDNYKNFVYMKVGHRNGFLPVGQHYYSFQIAGEIKPPNDYQSPNTKQRPLNNALRETNRRLSRMLRKTLRGNQMHDGSTTHEGGVNHDKFSDEQEVVRIETFVDDFPLAYQYGIVTEEIDNPYISDYETLFDVAVRKFQEIKMNNRTWRIKSKYLSCVELNKVVSFKPLGSDVAITGLVTSVNVNSSAYQSDADMEFTVASFEDLGKTMYYSNNLLYFPNFPGTNLFWKTIAVAPSFVRAMGGYCILYSWTSGAHLYQELGLEPGELYYVQFTIIQWGAGTLSFEVIDGGGTYASAVFNGTGTFTFTFVPRNVANVLKWSCYGVNCAYYLFAPYLMKVVIR